MRLSELILATIMVFTLISCTKEIVVEEEPIEIVKIVEVPGKMNPDIKLDLSGVESIVDSDNLSWPREITVMNGKIIIEKEPQRILTISLGHDEMLFGFVELNKIVATTSFTQDPSGNVSDLAVGLPIISADPEIIVSQDPDIVFADPYADPSLIDSLTDLGIPVVQTKLHNDEEGRKSDILLIGYALGELESAQALIKMLDERIDDLELLVKSKINDSKPRVLIMTYYDGYWAGGSGSTEDSIITLAGGVNVAAEAGVESNDMINKESLISMNPDVIIIPQGEAWGGRQFLDDLIADTTLRGIEAIKNKKVYLVEPRYFTTLSHWNIRGAEELVTIFWSGISSENFVDFIRK